LKRWNLTSNVTPTPISSRTSDARIWHSWPLTTTQHHPYASEVQERVMPGCGIFGPLLLPLYLHFKLFLKRWCLTSNVTHKPPSDPDSPPRLTYPTIFSRFYTSILTIQKRWSLTSNVTLTPKLNSVSTHRVTHPRNFSRHSTSILTFFEAVGPYLQLHPYANEVQGKIVPGCCRASPLLLPLHLHFNVFLERWGLTSNVIPTSTQDPIPLLPTLRFFPDSITRF